MKLNITNSFLQTLYPEETGHYKTKITKYEPRRIKLRQNNFHIPLILIT